MFIATVTRTKYRPNGKVDFKLVKGQEVKPSVLRKLKEADRIAWTRAIDKDASINRRIVGRQASLDALGYYSDVNLEVMKFLSNNYTNKELLAFRSGQNGMVKSLEKKVFEFFGLKDRQIDLQHTDDFKQGVEATAWHAWPVTEAEAIEIQTFLALV